ncbi:MAG: hypothetical protein QOF09_2378, partial [Alphaproteobacteria bacterium]|nr:hypothetical protein [Alphaproteobacteria bacterium]
MKKLILSLATAGLMLSGGVA